MSKHVWQHGYMPYFCMQCEVLSFMVKPQGLALIGST
jgi:hypothetical protein